MSFLDFNTPAGVQALDDYIATKRFIQGYLPTQLDVQAVSIFTKAPSSEFTHALRYYNQISGYTAAEKAKFRAGADVPAAIAGPVKASSASPSGSKVAPAAAPAPAAAAVAAAPSADLAKLEEEIKKQGDVIRDLKAKKADKAQLQPEVDKLLALKAKLPAGYTPSATPATPAAAAPAKEETKKEEKKEEKKEKKEKKEEAKEEGGDKKGKKDKKKDKGEGKPAEVKKPGKDEPTPPPGVDLKKFKAADKEGGKKGQDILGVHEMGGLEFFCTSVDSCDGDLQLVNICLNAMNQEVDLLAEEKRGGAGVVGKMIFSAGIEQLAIVAKIPDDKAAKVSVKDWLKAAVDRIQGEFVGEPTDTYGQAIAKLDKAKGRYPIKLKDEAISAAVEYLQQHDCFPKDTGDSDSDIVYGDDDF